MGLENTKKIANELLLEKYEPILVIKLRRIPPLEELHAFANKIQEDFKYPTLVLPGELETTVDLVSICKTKVSEVEDLKNQVFNCIENLDKELESINESPTLKRAKDLLDGKEN